MKIFEAARIVMLELDGSMSARDIYAEIVKQELYEFGAKNPVSVLSQAMNERAVGNGKQREEIFVRTAPGHYKLANRQ